jgi:hypothetical protein
MATTIGCNIGITKPRVVTGVPYSERASRESTNPTRELRTGENVGYSGRRSGILQLEFELVRCAEQQVWDLAFVAVSLHPVGRPRDAESPDYPPLEPKTGVPTERRPLMFPSRLYATPVSRTVANSASRSARVVTVFSVSLGSPHCSMISSTRGSGRCARMDFPTEVECRCSREPIRESVSTACGPVATWIRLPPAGEWTEWKPPVCNGSSKAETRSVPRCQCE